MESLSLDETNARPRQATTAEPMYPVYVRGQELVIAGLTNDVLMNIVDACGSDADGTGVLLVLSLVNKTFRSICSRKLFAKIYVRGLECKLHTIFAEVAAAADILPCVRSIVIRHELCIPPASIFSTESFDCHESLPAVMLHLLNAMPSLVEVNIESHGAFPPLASRSMLMNLLRIHALSHKVSVPTATSLKITAATPVGILLTDVFPNLTSLHLHVGPDTTGLGAMKALANLKRLHLDRRYSGWTLNDIQPLVDVAPAVQYLILDGELGNTSVSSLVDTFGQFQRLEHLAIPNHQFVFPGFRSMAVLPYSVLTQKEEHALNEDDEQNALRFLLACPQLEHITFLSYDESYKTFVARLVSLEGKVEGREEVVEAVAMAKLFHSVEEMVANPCHWDGKLPPAF